MKELSIEDYIAALEKMKKSSRDRIGILGELGATGLGTLFGTAVSGTAATVAGAATLAGSTTLASLLGGIFITTTPVGWVVGSTMVGGAIGYGVSKLVRSGGKSDKIREMNIQELEERIGQIRRKAQNTKKTEKKMCKIIEGLQLLVKNKIISQNKATDLLAGIEKRNITIDYAFNTIQEMVEARNKK